MSKQKSSTAERWKSIPTTPKHSTIERLSSNSWPRSKLSERLSKMLSSKSGPWSRRWLRGYSESPPVKNLRRWLRGYSESPPVKNLRRWLRGYSESPPVKNLRRWLQWCSKSPLVKNLRHWPTAGRPKLNTLPLIRWCGRPQKGVGHETYRPGSQTIWLSQV